MLIFINELSIYKFGLSVCLFVCLSVCLYPINVKTAEPIGPKFFVGSRVTPGKVYGWSNLQKCASIKIRFLKFLKIHEFFFWKSATFFVFVICSVSDPYHFDADPHPWWWIRILTLIRIRIRIRGNFWFCESLVDPCRISPCLSTEIVIFAPCEHLPLSNPKVKNVVITII